MQERELRLAVVSDAVYPWNTGGKEMRYHELLRRMAAHGIAVDIYTMKWWRGGRTVERDGITYHAICPLLPLYAGPRRSVLQALLFSLATLRLVTRRFDVLEADVIPFLQVYPLKAVALVRRRPFVVTWHELWGRDYWVDYLGGPGRVAASVEAWAARLPDRIIAASEGTARRVRAVGGPRADVRIVPNGVDPAEMGAVSTSVALIGPDAAAPELVAVGRLLRHKNVHLILEALAILGRRGRQVSLTVIGEGPESESLQKQAADLGLTGQVTFSPFLSSRTSLLEVIASAKALVFPSVREGFGMVALEALALGTPVVTSNHVDNLARELIDHGVTGRICPPDAASLASAVEQVLDDDPQAVAQACRAAAQEYDWDQLAARAAEVYR